MGDAGPVDAAPPPPPAPPTTADQQLVPTHPLEAGDNQNPGNPANQSYYFDNGYADYVVTQGRPHIARTLTGERVPELGANPTRLIRFAHLADLQLVDDESPTRVAYLDAVGQTSGALRPQDPYLCLLARNAVHTINAFHRNDPVDLTILGGDNIDNAQQNELDWLIGILNGGEVECDSGADDEIIAGPGNDPKDLFESAGLDMPWYWVSGNHDELIQGNVSVSGAQREIARSGYAAGGALQYEGGPKLYGGAIESDWRRYPLTAEELMERLSQTGSGHGIGPAQVERGKAFYHFDVEGSNIRFVVMDTASEAGGAQGMLRQRDVDAFVKPALDEAEALGRYVVLVSHHSALALTEEGGTLGQTQADALLPADWQAFLDDYDHVLFSMVGHAHFHRARPIITGRRGYWEVMTSAIADFPHQFRLVEIWDGDNGFLMLKATATDLDTEGDELAEAGRLLGFVDFTSGWASLPASPPPGQQNVLLWIRKPQ